MVCLRCSTAISCFFFALLNDQKGKISKSGDGLLHHARMLLYICWQPLKTGGQVWIGVNLLTVIVVLCCDMYVQFTDILVYFLMVLDLKAV